MIWPKAFHGCEGFKHVAATKRPEKGPKEDIFAKEHGLFHVLPSLEGKSKSSQSSLEVGMESIGVTLHPDGSVKLQGGYVHSVDKKGHMRNLG